MRNNIGYHTRASGNNTVKCCGGSFGGSLDMETANRLVNAMFTVKILNSGRAVFVDRQNREVSLYISVDPESTEAGKLALMEDRKVREQRQQVEAEKMARVNELIDGMSADELLKRLEG